MSLEPLAKQDESESNAMRASHSDHAWPVDNRNNMIASELMHSRQKQKKKVEEAIRLASRLTRLLEVLPGGVIVLDGQGIIQQSNHAATALLGEPLDGQLWSSVIERAFDPQADDGHDISLKNGSLVHLSTSPLDGEPGQIVLLQDVTEKYKLQQKVTHLQRLSAMGEMAARLAHQIRTPLSSAMLFIAPLLKDETDPLLKKRFAHRLRNSISHMEQLVKDMLAFSRGDMTASSPVDIDTLLEGVEQQFFAQSDCDNIHLEIRNSFENVYAYGCKDALASAVNNLVNNAVLACEGDGHIIVLVEPVMDEVGTQCIEINVNDNGVGISKEDQKEILTPFFTTRSSGTGLGLAVVQSIVKAHKGDFWFVSSEGEGSTFCIRVPMYKMAGSSHLSMKNKEQ